MHCCEAFSLSQSVLRVGSHEVAWIWDRRPAPATPATPNPTPGRGEDACRVGDTATTGGEEPGVIVLPKPAGVAVTADIGATTAARPLCAGEGEAELALEWAPLAAECPTGRELVKVGNSEAPLLCPVTPKPRAPPLDCSPKLSAMARGLVTLSLSNRYRWSIYRASLLLAALTAVCEIYYCSFVHWNQRAGKWSRAEHRDEARKQGISSHDMVATSR